MVINLRVKTLDSQDHEFSVEDDVSITCFFLLFHLSKPSVSKRTHTSKHTCLQTIRIFQFEIDLGSTAQRTHPWENKYCNRSAKTHILWTCHERWQSTKRLQYDHLFNFLSLNVTLAIGLDCNTKVSNPIDLHQSVFSISFPHPLSPPRNRC